MRVDTSGTRFQVIGVNGNIRISFFYWSLWPIQIGAKDAYIKLINSSTDVLMNVGESMTIPCALKTLLFSVCLFVYQQGLANDTYDLEGFRQYQKTNWKPPSKKQRRTGQPVMSPLENIRIGFFRLNLTSDDLSGDERLETCENYEVAEQDFTHLINFYFNYVNLGNPLYRRGRIQTMLRLMHSIFDINISMLNGQSPENKELINAMAKSLFEQLFLSENIDGRNNPYCHYFYSDSAENQSNSVGVNNGLVLMFLAFLGPHFLSQSDLYAYFSVLHNGYTRKSYARAFSGVLLPRNIHEYDNPHSVAYLFTTAGLDAETALLIGLNTMASAAFEHMNSGIKWWPDTLKKLLINYLPYELLGIIYSNIARFCPNGRSCPVPPLMLDLRGMQEFTHGILGIDPEPSISEISSSESSDYLTDYGSDSGDEVEVEFEFEASDGEPYSDHQDPATVIQQQSELITQLREELASQTATEEAGAVGGAPGGIIECPVCFEPPQEMTVLESCGHAGMCKNCAERFVREQTGCPFCRKKPESYRTIFFMPRH